MNRDMIFVAILAHIDLESFKLLPISVDQKIRMRPHPYTTIVLNLNSASSNVKFRTKFIFCQCQSVSTVPVLEFLNDFIGSRPSRLMLLKVNPGFDFIIINLCFLSFSSRLGPDAFKLQILLRCSIWCVHSGTKSTTQVRIIGGTHLHTYLLITAC